MSQPVDLPSDPPYPSPTSAQVGGGAGPFYRQADSEAASHVPSDLQQLQQAAASAIPRDPQDGEDLDASTNDADDYANLTQQIRESLREPTSQERLAQGVLNISEQQGLDTPDSQRKRSKVSRACDECRRKKIRCDATSEPPEEPCSNCRRTGARCQFSRQPMKRGPSKGYIKELADRLNTLESQLGPGASQLYSGEPSYSTHGLVEDGLDYRIAETQDLASPPGTQPSRKRTHSVSESGLARENPLQLPQTPQGLGLGANHLAGATSHQSSPSTSRFWKYGIFDAARKASVGIPHEPEQREVNSTALPDWDEAVIDEYYRVVGRILPILPNSKSRLRSRVASCPATLREAFLLALDCCVRTSPASALPVSSYLLQSTQRAAELVSSSQFDNSTPLNFASKLVYVQTLVLMALASDNHGPAKTSGSGGPPCAEWLGRAIGMATHLKFNLIRQNHKNMDVEVDEDSDHKIAQRIWWSLFILDRWHATSTSTLLQMPEASSSELSEDQFTLSAPIYQIARLSYILGHLSTIFQSPATLTSPASPSTAIISTTLYGEIERIRESIAVHLSGPATPIHLAYWHVRLLVLRLTAATRPHELLLPAVRIAAIFNSPDPPLTPLNHHFAALAALTLVELTVFDALRRPAEKALADMEEALALQKGVVSQDRPDGWGAAIRELVAARRGELQRQNGEGAVQSVDGDGADGGGETVEKILASAKAQSQQGAENGAADGAGEGGADDGGEGSGGGGSNYDPMALSRFGYLAALARDD